MLNLKTWKKWILLLALIASGAGAAAGTVLVGYVTGSMSFAVKQPLQVEKPTVSGLPVGRAWFGASSDEGTEFSAAAQLYQGETANVTVPIVNLAQVPHVIEITVTAPTLAVPQGGNPSDYNINLDVYGSGVVTDIVRVGPFKWKGTVPETARGSASNPVDGIKIKVALGDMVPPGYYGISGQFQVVAY